MLDRYVDKLNQQSSFLVNGDVRTHYTKVHLVSSPQQIMNHIVDYAVWEASSEVWSYLGASKVATGFDCSLDADSRRGRGFGAPGALSDHDAYQRYFASADVGRRDEDFTARQSSDGEPIRRRPGS